MDTHRNSDLNTCLHSWNTLISQHRLTGTTRRKEFATKASNTVGSIQPIRLSQVDEIIELAFVIVFPYIEGTLGTHYVKRCFNSNRVYFLEFDRSSNNLEPFHVQYYSQANTLCAITQVQRATKMSVVFVRNVIMKMKGGFSVLLARYGSMKNVLENCFSANFKGM